MKNFINNLFKNLELPIIEPLFPKQTIILKMKVLMNEEKIKEMEAEFSKKMNANVVILDGKFSDDVKVI